MQIQKQEVVVGKAAKPIPVMILGVLVGHKSYPMKKYLFVLLIVVGVVMFMYKDQVKKTVADDSSMFGIGELLLLLSLTMDGLTGAVQERIKSESSPSAYAMMLNTNIVIIQRLEAGESNVTIAKEFGVNHSTISTIKKNKHKIEPLFNANVLKPKLGLIVSRRGTILSLEKLLSGDSLSVEQSDVTEWLARVWPNLRARFTDDEIFNADETGLFYKLTPDKTLKFRGEKCSGGKLSKDRITVMVAANMSGTTKKKLLVIGKSKNPKCFKNLRSLPVVNESNRKAWMTSDIFVKWVRNWDRDLTKQKKKFLLLVDNCPAHPSIGDLKSITLIFLPPNATSVLQPMDQGIIRALKSNFRKNLVLKIVANLDANVDTNAGKHPKIMILDAILIIYDAWNKLTSASIFNCFKHAGFVQDSATLVANNDDTDDEVPLSILARALNNQLPIGNEELKQYSAIDDDLATCEEPTEENIVQNIIGNSHDSDDNNEDDLEENCTTPSVSEAIKAAEVLNVHADNRADVLPDGKQSPPPMDT
uniref:SFRICE_029010 n=1 Tax=Spodoptera frugiperda TaxID=7108 RepID=A0A2H1W5C7_SPOFR